MDALQLQQFRVYLFPGRLPDGLPLLRFGHRRPGTEPLPLGDARTGLPAPEDHGGEGLQRGRHGNRGAAGQLRQSSDVSSHIDRGTRITYQPAQRHGVHLRDRSQDLRSGRGAPPDHAGHLPPRCHPGEKEGIDACGKRVRPGRSALGLRRVFCGNRTADHIRVQPHPRGQRYRGGRPGTDSDSGPQKLPFEPDPRKCGKRI